MTLGGIVFWGFSEAEMSVVLEETPRKRESKSDEALNVPFCLEVGLIFWL